MLNTIVMNIVSGLLPLRPILFLTTTLSHRRTRNLGQAKYASCAGYDVVNSLSIVVGIGTDRHRHHDSLRTRIQRGNVNQMADISTCSLLPGTRPWLQPSFNSGTVTFERDSAPLNTHICALDASLLQTRRSCECATTESRWLSTT